MSLTESMTRLCGEIVAGRVARLVFVQDLGHEVASLKAGLRQAHREMAGGARRNGKTSSRIWDLGWRA